MSGCIGDEVACVGVLVVRWYVGCTLVMCAISLEPLPLRLFIPPSTPRSYNTRWKQ